MPANPLAPDWLGVPDDANALADGVWPRNAGRTGGGELELAGIPVSALAARFGTPLYVMDEADLRSRALVTREAFDREAARIDSTAKVYYAAKAFLSTQVARWVDEAGLYLDVCTGGEYAVGRAAGVEPERMALHGNNKSLAEIDRVVGEGIGVIVVDSPIEVERVADAAARHGRVQKVRIRVNSGVHAHTHDYLATAREDQKFGITIADTPTVAASIRARNELEFLGLHSHIGSQIFGYDAFAEAARRLMTVHAALLEGGDVPELNLGGGFGIAYTDADDPVPIAEHARVLADIVSSECARLGVAVPLIAVEPGRSIVGPSTVTLYEVGTIKDVEVQTGADAPAGARTADAGAGESSTGALSAAAASAVRRYVSVDGGMSDNARTALYSADYSVRIANRVSTAEPELVRVVGKHCESGDIVVLADYLPGDVAVGDLLAVPVTGAYCWSLASNYNHVGRPPVVAVADGEARVLVYGETEADLLARDAGIRDAPRLAPTPTPAFTPDANGRA